MSHQRSVLFATGCGLLVTALSGCGENLLYLTASLGGYTAGERGALGVLFINNTPHRAVFTFGSYDPADQFSEPDFDQFGPADPTRTLDGNGVSEILTFECARTFSLGSPGLLTLIEENPPDRTPDETALVEGVGFFDVSGDNGEGEQVGVAAPFEARLGVDFPCNALLIFRLEIDDLGPDPFRVDFELITSESQR